MKKKIFLVLLLVVVVSSIALASGYKEELAYMEGDWYDDNGNLVASIKDGNLNGSKMNFLGFAGAPDEYTIRVQVSQNKVTKSVELKFSNEQVKTPLDLPNVSIGGVVVQKKSFIMPEEIQEDLYGKWKDTESNNLVNISRASFNDNTLEVISFYGTKDKFIANIKIKVSDTKVDYFRYYKDAKSTDAVLYMIDNNNRIKNIYKKLFISL